MLSGSTWSRFRTTRWSLVGRVRGRRQDDEAMATLSLIYRPAGYAYLRRTGKKADAADALRQGLVSERVGGRRRGGRRTASRRTPVGGAPGR